MDYLFWMFGLPLSIVLWGGAIAMISSVVTGFLTIWNARKITRNV